MASLILTFLPLLLLATLSSALLRLNIDCGSSTSYTDDNGLKWVPDDPYISTGEPRAIETASDSVPDRYKTLRFFPARTKNCYTIPVEPGEPRQILVRVSFNYGNFDGRSTPPKFELIFDGNDWGSVETREGGNVFVEVVYVVNGESTSVCVGGGSDGQFPFVSAIQVMGMEMKMYGGYDPSTYLSLVKRVAFGAPETVRYPDDAYDRMWIAVKIPDSLNILTTDATTINTTVPDKPPAAALKTAVTPADPLKVIILETGLGPDPVSAYINFYFSETSQLGSDEKRSFAIFVDGKQVSDPIEPEYAKVSEYHISNVTATGKNQLGLASTESSTLLPLINAMEVFTVSDKRSNGTDAADVLGLENLVENFDELKGWSGDPCLPKKYNWDWVGCSSDEIPRVTAIYLNGYGLSGKIPDLSSMDALETIDLHNNSISGAIPEFLGKMPSLKQLNLADNSLSGPIPSSLANSKDINLKTSGNPNLCASGQSCKVISSPENSPSGSRKVHPSSAKKKSSSLISFFGLIIFTFYLFCIL